jgi:hypothetical protein
MAPHGISIRPRPPAAEVDVSPDLVRRLLAGQQPDLAGLLAAIGRRTLSAVLGE